MPNGYEQEQSDKRVRHMLNVERLVKACEYSVYLETVEPPASIEDRIQARLAMKAALAPFAKEGDDENHHD